jgi:spore maturation protein A
MLLQFVWYGITAAALVWGIVTGQGKNVLPAMLEGTTAAISVSLRLASGYLFFCGMIRIMNNLKIRKSIESALRPVLRLLMGSRTDAKAAEAVSLNLSANMLGLGNAATPYGIEAAERLHALGDRHGLYMLLILNATGLQLLPTTVLTLRIAAGSSQPNAILLPALAATAASTAVGAGLGLLCRSLTEVRHGA